jgi:hypothetical protein
MYIYLDESGDLGFDFNKKSPSSVFVIALLVCDNPAARKSFEVAVRRTLKDKLNANLDKSRIVQELKGTRTIPAIKKYFYQQIRSDDWGIYAVALNKQRVNDELRTSSGREKLYNFLSRLLLEKLALSAVTSNVELIVDKRKTKAEIRDFNQYLGKQLKSALPGNTAFHIAHQDSQATPGLQAVDLFCWGVFRKYESRDTAWYNVFRKKIRYETFYLR